MDGREGISEMNNATYLFVLSGKTVYKQQFALEELYHQPPAVTKANVGNLRQAGNACLSIDYRYSPWRFS